MKKKIRKSNIDFESPIFAFFDSYFLPFNKSNEKINARDQRNLGCSTSVLVFGCELMNDVSHLSQAQTKIIVATS